MAPDRAAGATRRRTHPRWLLALVIALFAAGCAANGPGRQAPTGPPVAGGTLKVAFFPDNGAFACVDPFQVYWIEHRTVIRNLADSLTDQDPRTGAITPWLARSWEISADGRRYVFHLRDGVTFSDGSPLDAAAVKANFDGFQKTVAQTGGTAFGASYIQGLDHAEVLDPRTVAVVFSAPNSSFLQATSTTNLAMISPASFDHTPQERCRGDFVASGPFTLQSYRPNQLTTLVRRPDYAWASPLSANQRAPYLDAVQFSYVAEDSVRTGNLTSGAIDIAWPRNPFTREDRELIESSGASVQSRPLPGVAYTHWANTSAGHPLADPLVRRALQKSLDLRTYAATTFGEDYPVVAGAYDSTTPDFVDQSAKLAYDPAGAGQLLDRAGWTVGEGGYRYRAGRRLVLILPTAQFSVGTELIQDQLKKVGFDLQIQVTTAAERPAKLRNGQYDLVENYFTRADPGALRFILDPSLANSRALAENATDPQTRALVLDAFAAATQTTDPARTRDAYARLQSILIDDGVAFPVFERVQYAGIGAAVHGFGFTSEGFLKLNDVWKQR